MVIHHFFSSDRMKDQVVAKLCSQCEDMFGDALKHLQKETLKTLWDREWIPRVAGKQSGYHGLAQYHQSRVSSVSWFKSCY